MTAAPVFWQGPRPAQAVRAKFEELLRQDSENGGALKVDTDTVITVTSFGPGYLDKEKDIIMGLQTDEPLKRACNPFGGMRMVRSACKGLQVHRVG